MKFQEDFSSFYGAGPCRDIIWKAEAVPIEKSLGNAAPVLPRAPVPTCFCL